MVADDGGASKIVHTSYQVWIRIYARRPLAKTDFGILGLKLASVTIKKGMWFKHPCTYCQPAVFKKIECRPKIPTGQHAGPTEHYTLHVTHSPIALSLQCVCALRLCFERWCADMGFHPAERTSIRAQSRNAGTCLSNSSPDDQLTIGKNDVFFFGTRMQPQIEAKHSMPRTFPYLVVRILSEALVPSLVWRSVFFLFGGCTASSVL